VDVGALKHEDVGWILPFFESNYWLCSSLRKEFIDQMSAFFTNTMVCSEQHTGPQVKSRNK
jgi:hypothetical protein